MTEMVLHIRLIRFWKKNLNLNQKHPCLPDSILNSQHLDDGDDNLDEAMPDDLNDQNLSELASSISAHDLKSMSQALTATVLNSALDPNVPNLTQANPNQLQGQISQISQGQIPPGVAGTLQAGQQIAGMQILQGAQGQLQLQSPLVQGQGQLLQGHVIQSQVPGNPGQQMFQGPASQQLPGSGPESIVQNLLQTPIPSAVAGPSVTLQQPGHPMQAQTALQGLHKRPNILQGSRMLNSQNFQIQGPNIQLQSSQNLGTGVVQGQPGGQQKMSVLKTQLAQGPLPPNQFQIQMPPSAIAALGGAAFTISPQGTLMPTTTGVGMPIAPGTPTTPGQLLPSPATPTASQASIANLPCLIPPGQVNGTSPSGLFPTPPLLNTNTNASSAATQLKQMVSNSQAPNSTTMTHSTTNVQNSKKNSNPKPKRQRRSKKQQQQQLNPATNKNIVTAATVLPNAATTLTLHPVGGQFAAAMNQSQQSTGSTLPLLTANALTAENLQAAGLKLALPLQALLPSDVSAVLTTVNGTSSPDEQPTSAKPQAKSKGSANHRKSQKAQAKS